jgi:hypothetical protein
VNPFRQLVHVLIKDIRGHLPEIGVVLLLNIAVTLQLTQSWTESFESTETPLGGAAQLLLVLAWCVLIGRVVLDDGLAARAPQWLTRPCSRSVLLAAKVAFVLLVVHVPSFLSQLLIVSGSSVPLSIRQLLLNQAVFAASVSLPAMALATLTKNLSHFVFGGIAIAAAALLVIAASASRNPFFFSAGATPFYIGYATFLVAAEFAIFAMISGVAIVAQYRWRSTLRVAIWSLVALSVLGLAMFALPLSAIQRARAALVRENVTPTIRLRDVSERRSYAARGPDAPLVVSLPVDTPITNGFSPTDESLPRRISVEVRSAAGDKVRLVRSGLRRDDGNRWLDLELTPSDYDSLKDSPVSVRIAVEFESYEMRETEPIPLDGSFTIVADRAQCGMSYAFNLRRVYCRTAFGWSIWFPNPLNRPEAQQMWLPVRLRFAINPVQIVPIDSYAPNNPLPGAEIATQLREPVNYTRQDVTIENIRLGDWGP